MSAAGHAMVRPGQVAPGLPAPDACMVCGCPAAEHSRGLAEVFRLVDELDATEARRALRLLAQDYPPAVAGAVALAREMGAW